MRYKISILCLVFFAKMATAQTAVQLNSSEIKLGLKKLTVLGSILYIAAHPDDENTKLLAYLSKDRLYRTGYLSLTRGDGGQNLIGNEQGDLLGLIRTQELLAARKIDGAEQFFTRANDFGFSKTAEETLQIWDKEQILSDVVWSIRKFRPDVIITRFPDDLRAGHGNHQSSSRLAQEAFTAAADPTKFPEQLKYVKPWQAKRILWNASNFGGGNAATDGALKIDIGAYNNLLGKSYGEIAAESRSNHKSQGMGSASQRGQSFEYFSLWKGDLPKTDLMEGIETSWKRVAGADKIDALANKIYAEYNPEKPQNSVKELVALLTQTEGIKDEYWKEQKAKAIKDMIAACAGLWFESYSAEPVIALGATLPVRSQVVLYSDVPVKLIDASVPGEIIASNAALIPQQSLTLQNKTTTSKLTQPYWIAQKHPIGNYTVNDQLLIGNPVNIDPLSVTFQFEIDGKRISYERPIVYKYTDQIRGEVYQPLTIAPSVTANLENKVLLFNTLQAKTFPVKIKAYKDNALGNLTLKLPEGWVSQPAVANFALKAKGDEQIINFQVSPSAKSQSGILTAVVETEGQTFSKEIKTLQYDHIPTITFFPDAEAKLVKLDLKTTGKKVGYIAGAGDLVPDVLKQIGYQVTMLNEDEIMNGNLSVYDAIITGVRAYNIDNRLKYEQPNLLKYVENGGNLVIQYNVNRPLIMPQIGPYPFTVSANRVTDEFAKVSILEPQSPVLNFPNKITEKDFEGWIQERGIYFATDIDPKYHALLGMNDVNEASSNGSLLVTDYGKGKFVYTSLVFFRELPAGVPGAYRLFVNLLSKNK